mmetsp:Transcript_53330/g.167721  ORF Transcript_53330/g.167721 Transcript_53330/m.167721 type:complete len:231 (+) Transcript_53330:330-1022(+)
MLQCQTLQSNLPCAANSASADGSDQGHQTGPRTRPAHVGVDGDRDLPLHGHVTSGKGRVEACHRQLPAATGLLAAWGTTEHASDGELQSGLPSHRPPAPNSCAATRPGVGSARAIGQRSGSKEGDARAPLAGGRARCHGRVEGDQVGRQATAHLPQQPQRQHPLRAPACEGADGGVHGLDAQLDFALLQPAQQPGTAPPAAVRAACARGGSAAPGTGLEATKSELPQERQ